VRLRVAGLSHESQRLWLNRSPAPDGRMNADLVASWPFLAIAFALGGALLGALIARLLRRKRGERIAVDSQASPELHGAVNASAPKKSWLRILTACSVFSASLTAASLGMAASPSRSAGCGLMGKPTGDLRLRTKDGKGAPRDYEVLVPKTYDPAIPLAVTFVFHGANATSKDAKNFGLQDAPGAAAASLFVFPQGVAFQSYGVGWDDTCAGYDMPFFDHMLADLSATYCIDESRVFAAGFSWGGDQVTALACCRGDRLRGVAAASCSDEFKDAANYQSYANLPCPVRNAAAIRFTHDSTGDGALKSPLFVTTSALFRSFNGCSANATAVSPKPCLSYTGCATPFTDCPYDGLGHSLPRTWAGDTWAFFSTTAGMPLVEAAVPVTTTWRRMVVPLAILILAAGAFALFRRKR